MNYLKNTEIGLSIGGFLKSYTIEESFKKIKEIGYSAVDYPLCLDWNKENPLFNNDEYIEEFTTIRKKADAVGLKINQTHGFFPMEYREYEWLIETYKRQIHATSILGAKYIVIHPMIPDYRDRARELTVEKNVCFLSDLLPFLKEYNVIACIENLWEFDKDTRYIVRTNTSTADDLLRIINILNDDHYAACLDFGHMLLIGADIATAIRKFGSNMKVVHAHDNDCFSDSHDIPTFGKANWKEIISALNDVKYEGVFNMELNIGGRVGKYDKDLVPQMAQFAYNVAKSLLTKTVK